MSRGVSSIYGPIRRNVKRFLEITLPKILVKKISIATLRVSRAPFPLAEHVFCKEKFSKKFFKGFSS